LPAARLSERCPGPVDGRQQALPQTHLHASAVPIEP
jgi:hypothetical protein